MDAKTREQSCRKRIANWGRGQEGLRRASRTSRPSQGPNTLSRFAPHAEELRVDSHEVRNSSMKLNNKIGDSRLSVDLHSMSENKPAEGSSDLKHSGQDGIPFSGPLLVPSSSGFAWAKRPKEGKAYKKSNNKSSSRGHDSGAVNPSSVLKTRNTSDSKVLADRELLEEDLVSSKGHGLNELVKKAVMKQWAKLEHPHSFDDPDMFHSQRLSEAVYLKDEMSSRRSYMNYRKDQQDKVEFSGPLLSQSYKVDELLQKHERHIRQVVRRSWFQRGRKEGR